MEKKAEILLAAQSLFSQFGLKKVTTEEISQEAGISKATLYKYYNNKREIFLDVVQVETDQMLSAIKDAIDRETTVSSKLHVYLLTKFDKISELINFYRVTRATWGEHWPYIDEVTDSFMEEEKKLIKAILEEGNRTGELDIKDVYLVAHVMVVSLKSIEYPWAIENHDITLNKLVDAMIGILMDGVNGK
jgi:AcrR family transcriptional regulator